MIKRTMLSNMAKVNRVLGFGLVLDIFSGDAECGCCNGLLEFFCLLFGWNS